MKTRVLAQSLILGTASLLMTQASHAVHVSENGEGQVLLFPYYTVNGGHSTLLSLTNHRDTPKALRITFREGRHGANVLSFNIYLGAQDVWTAAIVADPGADAPARIFSSDETCTVPALPAAGQPFLNFQYAVGDPQQFGPAGLDRTREGFIEVIEAGELVDPSAASPFKPASLTNARNCMQLDASWAGGPWANNNTPVEPSVGVAPPGGGLSGNAILVDAANGSSFSYRALALADFFRARTSCLAPCVGVNGENLHTLPFSLSPNLGDARNGEQGGSSARFHRDGREYVFAFEGDGAGLKSVSAALMQQTLGNEFNARASSNLAARSEWVLTLPTRGLHLGAASAPLRQPFSPSSTQLEGACEDVEVLYWNRAGLRYGGPEFLPPPNATLNLPKLCHATQVWSFNQQAQADAASAPSSILGSRLNHNVLACQERTRGLPGGCAPDSAVFQEGRASLSPRSSHQFLATTAAPTEINGGQNILLGLPVIGLWISSFQSTGVPGVLANFTLQQPHAGSRATRSGEVSETTAGASFSETGAEH